MSEELLTDDQIKSLCVIIKTARKRFATVEDALMFVAAESFEFGLKANSSQQDQSAQIAELEKENAELRRDAERLDFMLSNNLYTSNIMFGGYAVYKEGGDCFKRGMHDTQRDAIDNAMQSSQKEE